MDGWMDGWRKEGKDRRRKYESISELKERNLESNEEEQQVNKGNGK